MLKKFIELISFFLFYISIFLFSYCQPVETLKMRATAGVLDLREVDLSKVSIALDGEWEFFGMEFIEPGFEKKEVSFIDVPGIWNQKLSSKYGYASYRLRLLLSRDQEVSFKISDFGTAYRLLVNGEEIARVGRVSEDPNIGEPEFRPIITKAKNFGRDLEVIFLVSNYHYKEGGFWYSIFIGTEENLKLMREKNILLDMFLLGSILIMGIYHFSLFLVRKKDKSSLYFALFCIVIVLRLLSQNERYILNMFSGLYFHVVNKMEYLGYYLALPTFNGFIYSLFPEEYKKRVLQFVWFFSISFSLIVLFSKSILYTETVIYFHILTLFCFLYILYVMVLGVIRGRESIWMILSGTLVLILGATNDILHSQEIIHTTFLVPYSLLVFIFIQSVVLSVRFSEAFHHNEELVREMLELNTINRKFVPVEFLESLGKKNFTQIKLGDQTEKEMTVLFSDIRNFTSISEKMTPEQSFHFINNYLSKMGPIVRKHGGFIDKFIGDAILALYYSPKDAILSAIEMQKDLEKLNESHTHLNQELIEIGIGIHTGRLMMGVIGEQERFESTVISDVVNTASRIEGLTKIYNSKILVSEDVLMQLDESVFVNYLKLDVVRVKGKLETFAIYEILDGLSDKNLKLMLATKLAFETGIECFFNKDIERAKQLFDKVLEMYPEHSSARLYLERCITLLKSSKKLR